VARCFADRQQERQSDIVRLAGRFLQAYSSKNELPAVGFSDDAILALQNYFYPGNVRELENMVERAVLMARGRVLMPEHFPAKTASNGQREREQMEIDLLSLPFHKSIAELEKHRKGNQGIRRKQVGCSKPAANQSPPALQQDRGAQIRGVNAVNPHGAGSDRGADSICSVHIVLTVL